MCWPRESLESNTTVKQVIRKISYWKCSDRSVSDWNKAELGRVKWSWNNPEVEAFSEPKSMLLSCFHLSYNFRSRASNLKPQLNGKTLRVTFERSLKVIFIKNCTSSDLKLSNDYSHLRSMQTPIFTKLLLFYFACFFLSCCTGDSSLNENNKLRVACMWHCPKLHFKLFTNFSNVSVNIWRMKMKNVQKMNFCVGLGLQVLPVSA